MPEKNAQSFLILAAIALLLVPFLILVRDPAQAVIGIIAIVMIVAVAAWAIRPFRLPGISHRRPEIFLSSTSRDLGMCRERMRVAVNRNGCFGRTMSEFPPSSKLARHQLREELEPCDALIHLVGERFGIEPRHREADEPRRSYTQMEYDMAVAMKRDIFVLICGPTFDYTQPAPGSEQDTEADDVRALQTQWRAHFLSGDKSYTEVADCPEAVQRTGEIASELRIAAKSSFDGKIAASTAWRAIIGLGVLLFGAVLYIVWQSGDLKAWRAAAEERGRLIDLVVQERQRLSPEGPGSLPSDEAALVSAARKQGLTLAEFRGRLTADRDQLLAMLPELRKQRTLALPGFRGEWARLEREVLELLGNIAESEDRYREAIDYFGAGRDLTTREVEPQAWLDITYSLAFAQNRQNKQEIARTLVRDALPFAEQFHRDAPEKIARWHSLLAEMAIAALNFGEAQTHISDGIKALIGEDAANGQDTFKVVESSVEAALTLTNFLRQRGRVLNEMGEFDSAEASIKRALTIDRAQFGARSTLVLIDLHALAALTESRWYSNYYKAQARRSELMAARTGKDSSAVSRLELVVERLCTESNALREKARSDYEAALHVQDEDPREKSHDKAILLNNFALFLRNTVAMGACGIPVTSTQEVLARAETLFRQALDIDRGLLGEEHREVATKLSNLATILQDSGKPDEAFPLYLKALKIDEKVQPPGHYDLGRDHYNLASWYIDAEHWDKAAAEARLAISIFALHAKTMPVAKRNLISSLESLESAITATGATEDEVRQALEEEIRKSRIDLKELLSESRDP